MHGRPTASDAQRRPSTPPQADALHIPFAAGTSTSALLHSDPVDDGLFTSADLRAMGFERPERETAVTRARRGVYGSGDLHPGGTTEAFLTLIHAADRTLTGTRIYSHESAAALLGLPIWGWWPKQIDLICERSSGGRTQRDVVRHCVGLEHVVPEVVDGMLVTSPGRTAFDIALSRPFEYAVILADAAFRDHPGARAEFAALLKAYGRRRGFRKAERVLGFADERSGSPGESKSRVEIDRLGFERPDLQVVVTTDGREEFADFGWKRHRALGEYDGEEKYRLDRYRRGGTIDDVVMREKNRENRMRRSYPNFARWDTEDPRERRLAGILLAARVPKRAGGSPPPSARYSPPRRGR